MSETVESFLIEQGLIQKHSMRRREILGCIACRWNVNTPGTEPRVHGYQILKCRGIQSGTLYPILKALTNAGVIEPHDEIVDKPSQGRLGGPVRKTYTPVDTELGMDFQAKLVAPDECHLGQQDLLLANLPAVHSPKGTTDHT